MRRHLGPLYQYECILLVSGRCNYIIIVMNILRTVGSRVGRDLPASMPLHGNERDIH